MGECGRVWEMMNMVIYSSAVVILLNTYNIILCTVYLEHRQHNIVCKTS